MITHRSVYESTDRSQGTDRGVWIASLVLHFIVAAAAPLPASGIGTSPNDPIPFDAATGAIGLAIGDDDVWLSTSFAPDSSVSHLVLETRSALDTHLTVFANRSEVLKDDALAEDDDSGPSRNAAVRVPLGFSSPYLVRVQASQSGSLTLQAELTKVSADRCDWPAGCPLAVAAQDEPTATEVLRLLRSVRSEILARTPAGQDLINLYWKLGKDLVPDLIADPHFRRLAYQEVSALLPLANDALEAAAGTGGRTPLSRAEYEQLNELLDLLLPHLSPKLAAELRGRWEEYDLARLIGMPLTSVLEASALLPKQDTRYTVIAKLRTHPVPGPLAGNLRLRTGDANLEAHLVAAGVQAIRRVHRESPARFAAGLTRTVAFDVDGLRTARNLVKEIASSPVVEWAEVSSTMYVLEAKEADPFRGDLWGLDAVRAPAAWSVTQGACSVPVAIVDTGLRSGLVDLEGRILYNRGYDFIDDDSDPEDGHGHGTHVAGTVASALENAVSIAGVAPETCFFAVKVLGDGGSGSSEGVAAGILHAVDQGARVINLSLGCDCDAEQVIEDALRYAEQRDVVVVAAAGNDGVERLHYPASSPRTIAVAALNQDLDLASFSSYGPGLDLAAPGVDIVSVFRDGESCTGSGTSMAAPHVSGVAALMRSANPELDRNAVQEILQEEAIDLGPAGYDRKFGAGMVDAFSASLAASAAGPSLTSDAFPDFRFRIRITAGDEVVFGQAERDCVAETLCVSGALPGRSELFVRIIGPRPNGFLWVNLVRFTTSRVEVWVEQLSSGEINYYDLPALPPAGTELSGLVDKRAFLPEGSSSRTQASRIRARKSTTPGVMVMGLLDLTLVTPLDIDLADSSTFTSSAFPGFRFRVRIFAGDEEQPAQVERNCIAETVCVSGSLPGRSELFLRIIGPRPNGFLWVSLVRFTTSRVEVEIEQRSTSETRTYVLGQVPSASDILPGRVDREAFLP